MQTLKKKTETKTKNEKPKDEASTKKPQDEKLQKGVYNVSTPRNFLPKSSTADIYGLKNKNGVQNSKAPKKISSTSYKSSNVSPMKDYLKSSPSSVSQISRSSDKKKLNQVEAKVIHSARQTPNTNVTVNSPIAKKKLNLVRENSSIKKNYISNLEREKNKPVKEAASKPEKNIKEVATEKLKVTERQRTKTRTLDENEVKILTPEILDNNVEMLKLTHKLNAKPKAFYVDLVGETSKTKIDKSSDDEMSYEDDFESYESDFDSYHSETNESRVSEKNDDDDEDDHHSNGNDDQSDELLGNNCKELLRDEERMLDSGSFDLRDRSAKTKPAMMEHILEDGEDPSVKKPSLTDEGFQEMSSSSAVSSLKTMHIDILDRPLFIDFSKSKETKRKKRNFERLKQRADDLLGMISLHEMSYTLFEMKPISYDLYMATFGRRNYTQTSCQTFDDGVSEEIQTEETLHSHKWTQHPVEFSKSDVYLSQEVLPRKFSTNTLDYMTKFTFLLEDKREEVNNEIDLNENYKRNPLRIYFEQKDGVGSNEMLPYESYKSRLRNNDYNPDRLRKFLKKFENRISNVLSLNAGNTEFTDSVKSTKFPFSKGFITISSKNISDDKLTYLKRTKITQVFFSENKSNLLFAVHEKSKNSHNKCIVCLWDISVAKREPVKILVAIDNIIIGRCRGNTDGIVVAALDDGSIQLWDLSEEAIFRDDVASEEKSTNLVENDSQNLTEHERDREWNLKNSHMETDQFNIHCALQACAYTSSAYNMSNGEEIDNIVGLEFIALDMVDQEGGRKVIGRVASLQRIGIITIWSIVQEKSKTTSNDIGKAYWSKMKLEKSQTISLIDYIDEPFAENLENIINFNLISAKRRVSKRKLEKSLLKKEFARPKSAISSDFEFDIDRPTSAASSSSRTTRMLPTEKNIFNSWENGIVCNDLKVIRFHNVDFYLVGKNCGEVLCCEKSLGAVKVQRFCVANDTSSVTSLQISPHGIPYFLAATDSGTVNLCSMVENRVLLTLDCRNIPSTQDMADRCQSDNKGRYISSVSVRTSTNVSRFHETSKLSVTSLVWSAVNPCCMHASLRGGGVAAWDLARSDIAGTCANVCAHTLVAGGNGLALLTHEGEVQIHRMADEQRTKEYLQLFEKYVALL